MASWAEGLAGPWAACVEREAPQFPPPTQGLGSVSFWTPPKGHGCPLPPCVCPGSIPLALEAPLPGGGSGTWRGLRRPGRGKDQLPESQGLLWGLVAVVGGAEPRLKEWGGGACRVMGGWCRNQQPGNQSEVRGAMLVGLPLCCLQGPAPKPVCLTSDFPRNPVQPSLPLCVHPMIQWEGGSLFLATQTAGPEPSIQVLVVKFLLEDQRQEVAGCTHRGDTDGLQWLWGVAE